MIRSRFAALSLSCAVWFAPPGETAAQSRALDKARAERAAVVPQPAESEAPQDRTRESEDAETPDDTPLGVDIAEIRLLAHQDQAESDPAPGSDRISIDPEILAPAGLPETLAAYLDRPVSMALLAELAKEIIHAWRDEDFPIVDVYFPEQNITAGKIKIVVREARLGQVRINDTRHTDPAYLERHIRLEPGDRIDRRILDADLDWLNRNPIRQTNLIYERGTVEGTSDIVLDTLEEKPVAAYLGFANTGVAQTGENEWSAGFNWLNPFGREHSAGYHFGADVDFETLESHTALYRAFLPWRHELRLLGAAVFSDVPGNPADPVPIGLGGENLQATVDYLIPLGRPRGFRGLRHDLTFGLDWKSTNTDLIFGGLNAVATTAEVFQFRVAWEGGWRDRLGHTLVTLASLWSPGDVLNHNDDASFAGLRAGATADYWYGYAQIERGIDLPGGCRFVARGRGQTTGDRLLSTEQVLAGGYLTVRGFDENLVRGDSGGIVNLELVSAPFSLAGKLLPEGVGDEWNALVFYDGAFLDNSDPLPGEVSPSLRSAGLGLTCKIDDRAHFRAAYGWILDTHGVPAEFVDDGRLHFGMTVSY